MIWLQKGVFYHMRTVISMRENLLRIENKVKEFTFLRMVGYIRANFTKIRSLVRESYGFKMEMFIMVSLKKVRRMGKVFIIIRTVMSIRADGRMGSKADLVYIFINRGCAMKEIGIKEKKLVKANFGF